MARSHGCRVNPVS